MTSGLPDGVLFQFGESRWRFHSLAIYVSSFCRILIKQNLMQSNKAGSLGSNISKSTISWKNDFHQPGLSTTNFDQYDSIRWLTGADTIKKEFNAIPVSSLKLRRYMCMGSMSECSVPSSAFIFFGTPLVFLQLLDNIVIWSLVLYLMM